MTKQKYFIFAFYNFVKLEDPDTLKRSIMKLCIERDLRGTVLVAKEGINGTIAGHREKIDPVAKELTKLFKLKKPNYKWSKSNCLPFRRLKVRLKNEIVTMGVTTVDPNKEVGDYVEPAEWNNIISDPNVVVIDVRNSYEVEIGSFPTAINPSIRKFGEFPNWLEKNSKKLEDKQIAMFCTGGIRCEKSTSYLKALGFKNVYHLKGGILNYLASVKKDDSLWEGECFVFDERVSVVHGVKEGEHLLCRACGEPITQIDTRSTNYEEGVSCHKCFEYYSTEQKARFKERQRQYNSSDKQHEEYLVKLLEEL